MDIFLQQIVNGLVQGSIYALVALGYTMVYGIMGLINFAHGEVVMIGTLVTITVAGTLIKAGMPVALAGLAGLTAAVLVCMALGWALERVAYRPLRNSTRIAALITAIGVSLFLEYVTIQYQIKPKLDRGIESNSEIKEKAFSQNISDNPITESMNKEIINTL